MNLTCKHYIGLIGLTALFNTGGTALVSKWLNHTISYTPALAAAIGSSPPFFYLIDHSDSINIKWGEKNKKRARFVCTLVLGGVFAKLFCPNISKTHALALSLLNFFSSHLAHSALYGYTLKTDPKNLWLKEYVQNVKITLNEFVDDYKIALLR